MRRRWFTPEFKAKVIALGVSGRAVVASDLTRARARTATVYWLEAVHNRQRRHPAIDMPSPVEYEERHRDHRAAG